MTSIAVGVVKERAPGERRVALVPDAVTGLREAGFTVYIEYGAGAKAWFDDQDYRDAGATVEGPAQLRQRCKVLLCVDPPTVDGPVAPRADQVLIGLLRPLDQHHRVETWRRRGITAISLDLLPRTVSRAQSMDALTSQSHIAGYRAAIVAAGAYQGFLPMLTTAAGTTRPASALVLGAGVAGLSAIGTLRRMGAVVSAHDIRAEACADARSLGATVLDLAVGDGDAAGGYARSLADDEAARQQERLTEVIGRFDLVLTTAQVPGGRPPLLVTDAAVQRMRPGSVLVDLAASALGGNIAGSEPDATTEPHRGVTVIGASNLASDMAPAASTAYSRNVTALLKHLAPNGALDIDPDDEIQSGVLVTHGGRLVNRSVADRFGRTEHLEAV